MEKCRGNNEKCPDLPRFLVCMVGFCQKSVNTVLKYKRRTEMK